MDAIEAFLKDQPVILLRDKTVTKFGDNLKHFMEYGAKRPHVIVVHSDKYWRSAFCLFELWTVDQELRKQQGKSLWNVVIPVEHLNSGITTVEGLERCLEHWAGFTGTPMMLGWRPDELKDHSRSLLRTFSNDLNACLNLNLHWKDGTAKVLAAIAGRLGLPTRKVSHD